MDYTDLKQEAFRISIMPKCPFNFFDIDMECERILDGSVHFHYTPDYDLRSQGWLSKNDIGYYRDFDNTAWFGDDE